MEIQPQQYADQYQIVSKVGKGGQAAVYLGRKNNQIYALKVFQYGASKQAAYRQEVQILKMLNHPNLIRMVDHRPLAKFKVDYEDEQRRPLIVQELAEGGQLFDYISKTGRFTPQLCRFYTRQLLSAISYLHSMGVTHRDLKPQNILFDSNYNLKLMDFGLSRDAKGSLNNYSFSSKVGTDGYRAPEVIHGNYNGIKVDIFALGVILFIMYAGKPPFFSSHPSDRIYGLIRTKHYDQFWQRHQKDKPYGFFPQSFKQLINRMVSEQPEERPTLQQITDSEWLNGEVPGYPALIAQMTNRAIKIGSKLQKLNLQTACNWQGVRNDLDLQDEGLTKQEVFNFHYFKLSIKASQLPLYDLKNVAYVVKDANLLVSWIYSYLFEQQKINSVFLDDSQREVKFERYQIDYCSIKHLVSIKLEFSIDQQNETQLVLKGQLHRNSMGLIGVSWMKLQGNSYWLSSVQAHIDQSFQALV